MSTFDCFSFQIILQPRRIAAALVLIGVALPSLALTIGRPQGATWIGKPVDLVIPLSLEEGEAGDSLCLEAEVVQGDTRVDDRRVTVSLESGSSAGTPRMHVRSTVAIDEPVVTVAVSAGCVTKSTRRYTLLADVPSDISVPGVSTSGPRPLPLPRSAFSSVVPQAGSRDDGFQRFGSSATSGNTGVAPRNGRRSAPVRNVDRTPDADRAPAEPRRPVVAKPPAGAAADRRGGGASDPDNRATRGETRGNSARGHGRESADAQWLPTSA